MKVALVYPRFRTMLAGGLEEPLGVLYVASVLRGAGHDVRFVDLTFAKSLDVLDGALDGADWIGTSSSSAMFGKAVGVLGYAKRLAPGTPTVIGGPHATVATEDALGAGFDYAFLGEAESTVLEFTELLGRERARECPGLAWMEDGRVRANGREGFISDLDAVPFPARDLIDYSDYPTIGIMASRGCSFNCIYCQPTVERLFGPRVRKRSPESIVDEIEHALSIAGDKDVYFKDDTLTLFDVEWFVQLRDELQRRGVEIRWQANSRVDTVTYDKLRMMRESGCVQIGFGVESGSPDVLKFYNKRTDPAETEQAFRWCHELGILPHAFLMLGAPDETLEDLKMTYDLVKRIKPRSWVVYTATPLPGTHMHRFAKERGLLSIEDYDGFDNAENSLRGRAPMTLRHVTQADITRYRNKINHYLLFANAFNPRVIRKAVRRPGAAIRKLRKVI
ncbi:MAG: radical SAM protein [Candidatus Eisenbacteria bacterium]